MSQNHGYMMGIWYMNIYDIYQINQSSNINSVEFQQCWILWVDFMAVQAIFLEKVLSGGFPSDDLCIYGISIKWDMVGIW